MPSLTHKTISFLKTIFVALGALWLPLEAYEGLSGQDVSLPFWLFLILSTVLSIIIFIVDGLFIKGFLRRTVTISSNGFDTEIEIKFGDLFSEQGWKAIAVNDFFDSKVDDDLVSKSSLHGKVLTRFWSGNPDDWQTQVNQSLCEEEAELVTREKGNNKRYSIGTTVSVEKDGEKFLFVALGKTDPVTNMANSDAEDLICAVRGLLKKARGVCANTPLIIPLMGSGLSRVGIKNSVLLDLILTATFEETKALKITENIKIVLPKEKLKDINLGTTLSNWK